MMPGSVHCTLSLGQILSKPEKICNTGSAASSMLCKLIRLYKSGFLTDFVSKTKNVPDMLSVILLTLLCRRKFSNSDITYVFLIQEVINVE